MAAQAADILDDHGTIDIDERQSSWRNEGWSGTYRPDDTTGTTTMGTTTGAGSGMGPAGLGSSPMGAGTLTDDSTIAGPAGSDMDERRRRTRIHGSNPGL